LTEKAKRPSDTAIGAESISNGAIADAGTKFKTRSEDGEAQPTSASKRVCSDGAAAETRRSKRQRKPITLPEDREDQPARVRNNGAAAGQAKVSHKRGEAKRLQLLALGLGLGLGLAESELKFAAQQVVAAPVAKLRGVKTNHVLQVGVVQL
ncbi:unnamed protein product, partial [Chrysoparadoxa australica]